MNEAMREFLQDVAKESQSRLEALDRLLSAADASRVFGQPVTSGQCTVITACEVASGGGFGSGMGFGLPRARRNDVSEEPGISVGDAPGQAGAGGGGGGGGGSVGRPVAVIVVSPDGVEVKPVLDVTKIALAALTAMGTMGILALKTLKRR